MEAGPFLFPPRGGEGGRVHGPQVPDHSGWRIRVAESGGLWEKAAETADSDASRLRGVYIREKGGRRARPSLRVLRDVCDSRMPFRAPADAIGGRTGELAVWPFGGDLKT